MTATLAPDTLGGPEPAWAAGTCVGELTNIGLYTDNTLTKRLGDASFTHPGNSQEFWSKNPSPYSLTNGGQTASVGILGFDLAVPDDAVAGDQYRVLADGVISMFGDSTSLLAPDGEVIATTRVDDGGLVLTYTDYVETHDDVTGTYRQRAYIGSGRSGDYLPELFGDTKQVFVPGKEYVSFFQGCEPSAPQTETFTFTTKPQYNAHTIRTGWEDGTVAKTTFVANGALASTATGDLLTLDMTIDRAGTRFDPASFDNTDGTQGFGLSNWSADGKVLTSTDIPTLVDKPADELKPGEYRMDVIDGRHVRLTVSALRAGQYVRTQFTAVPDDTVGWKALGEQPFVFTFTESGNYTDTKVVREIRPRRPMPDGQGTGESILVPPVLSKTRNEDGSFTLTVANTSTDGLVEAGLYADALYVDGEGDPVPLTITNPTGGSIDDEGRWVTPRLAPGEKVTATVAALPKRLQGSPGAWQTNRFGTDGECVDGDLISSEVNAGT